MSAAPTPSAEFSANIGTGRAHGAGAESAVIATGGRTASGQDQLPAGTVKARSGQAPRQGYTGYRQADAGRMIRASGAARYLP